MTNQRSDKLVNECSSVALGDLKPYAVAAGDIRTNHGWGNRYAFKTAASPSQNADRVTSLWRGYVSVYRLCSEGRLVLEKFEYPFEKNRKPDVVNELLEGDFFLVMKSQFRGPRTYIPFKMGVVISDKDKWVVEQIET